MGLFWKTDADRAVEALQDSIAEVNIELRWFRDNLIENKRESNDAIIVQHHIRLANLKNRSEQALENVPRHRLSSLSVPWIDGRFIPMMMWILSYQRMVAIIEQIERG